MRSSVLFRVLFLVAIAGVCLAQAPKTKEVRSLEEMLPQDSDAAKIISAWKTESRALDRSYADSWKTLRKKYVKELEAARKSATEADRLEAAIEIRDLLKVAQTLEPTKGEEAEPKVEVAVDKKEEKPLSSAEIRKAVMGDWTGVWAATGSSLSFSVDSKGVVSGVGKQAPLKTVDGRHFVLWEKVHQNLELVPSGDRLIVLGYTANHDGRQLDPLKDRPDYVAVVYRR